MKNISFRVWNSDKCLMLDERQGQIVLKLNGQLRDSYDEERILNWPPWMEFTGILDKNGVEIFEGDILAEEHDLDKDCIYGDEDTYIRHHLVRKAPGYFYHDEDNPHSLIINSANGWNYFVEVIGNMYETPELVDLNDLV